MKQYASIFNDVLGPVMRGPSSSHTAASVRIGKMLRQMLDGELKKFTVEFDIRDSLAASYHSQCADMGLAAGLLNMEPDDDNMPQACNIAKSRGIHIEYKIVDHPSAHPNTYRMYLENSEGEGVSAVALSVGGGMVKFTEINGFKLHITGGFYETLIFADNAGEDMLDHAERGLEKIIDGPVKFIRQINNGTGLIEVITEKAVCHKKIRETLDTINIIKIMCIEPCMPIFSQINPSVPFTSARELIDYASREKLNIWQAALKYESIRGNITEKEAYEKMERLVAIMENSIANGLEGTSFEKRILGCQSKYLLDSNRYKRLIPNDMVNEIIKCISAIMETKSSMGIFVAAPTAGSCGGLPGTVFGVARQLCISNEEIVKSMFAAGIIGVLISQASTFAAEVAGCQAECGAGSGLAGAALIQLMNGTVTEAINAASMSLQNILGMVCDPVAMGVEVPCLGKNIMCGLNAFASANMILAGFDVVVPLDETIEAYDEVGRKIPPELRCTGEAGLSVTKSSQAIKKELYD